MTLQRHGRGWWLLGVAALLAVCGAALLVYLNPFWLIDRGVRAYLRGKGVTWHTISVDGSRIEYVEALPHDSAVGPPLVLVHGLGARSLDWASLIPKLAEQGFHVYALDLPGYGNSAKVADGDYSLGGEEHAVSGFMAALHLGQADVAGWSMGGWIAMLLALDHPAQVRRLVLLDSAGLYFDPDFDGSLFAPADRAGLERLIARLEPDQPNITVPGWAVHGMLRRLQANGWVIQRSFRSMISGRDVLDFRLHQLKQPVLLLWGTEDKLIGYTQAQRLQALLPQSVLYGLSGCGHLTPAECASAVLPPMTRFLHAEPPEPARTVIAPGRPPTR